jgi:hypothetical protein
MTPMQASRALRDLAKVSSKISAAVSKRIKRDIEKYFSAGTDPYRKPWAPLKPATIAKGRHHPPLTDTRKGRRGIKVTPRAGAGVSIVSNTDYMQFHMRATPDRAARKFLPEGVLPAAWEKIVREELEKEARKLLKGATRG